MASTAAVLNIMVAANTAPASGQLLALQKQLAATTAQANTTSTTVGGGLSKGGKMAAVGLGAAAVAAIGVGKALSASVGAARSFESSFAEVRKTVDTNEAGFRRIERGLRNLAKQIPVPVEELNNLAGEAGALGIAAKDIVTFTRVAAQLGTTTNLSSEEASNALARLANIMGTNSSKFENLASTLVGLGNAGASTESEIAAMALRIASTGKQVGLTEADVLGFASALASVGIEAEAGGSAISRAFSLISESVATGNDKLSGFAKVAQMSVPEFSKLFERDAARGMLAFIKGLGEIKENGGNALVELQKLGINEIRLRNALLSAAGAGGLFNQQLKQASVEFQNNTALAEEAQKRYETFDSQVALLKNGLKDLGITIGLAILPALKDMVQAANDVVNSDLFKTALDQGGSAFGGFFDSVGDVFKAIDSVARLTVKEEGKPTIFQRMREDAGNAMDYLQEQTGREENLQKRRAQAIDKVRVAQRNLNAARRKHGPNSDQAAVAEARLGVAMEESLVAKRKLNRAEQTTGAVRRATKNVIASQVGQLKLEIRTNERLIRRKDEKIKLEESRERPNAKKILNLQGEIVKIAGKNERKQGSLNKLILEAANKVGPKFANSLEKMSARTAGIRKALGNLPGPFQRVGESAKNNFERAGKSAGQFRGSIDRTKKRVNSDLRAMPPVVKTSTKTMMDIFRERMDVLGTYGKPRVSKRRGGIIPSIISHFAKGGMVPAAVSPGEMISYGGSSMIVPGRPEPRDSVMMTLPAGAKVFTWDGQKRLLEGASESEALRRQAPHFANGGIVKPTISGGSPKSNRLANSVVGRVHNRASSILKSAQERSKASSSGAGFIGPPPGMAQLGNNAWVDANTWTVASFLAKKFGLRISSNYRSPAHNAAVGGVPNSSHTRGSPSNPGAFDFVPASTAMQSFAAQRVAGIVENMIHDVGSGLHNHIAFFRRGGIAKLLPRFKKGGWVKTGYTVFDDAMGYRAPLRGKAYAELGAPNGGVGYISRLLGINKELPYDFPLDVKVKGKTTKLYKRDIGYGQGTSAYSIDIWKSMWPFYGLNQYSKGPAWIRRADGKAGAAKAAKAKRAEEKAKKRQNRRIRKIAKRWGKYPGRDKIAGLEPNIDRLNERIELAERAFGADWSAGGSELDPVEWAGDKPPAGSERGRLIAYYQELEGLYKKRRNLILRAIAWLQNMIGRYRAEIKAIETGKPQRYKGKKIKPGPKWQLKAFKNGIKNARGAISNLNESKVDLQGLTGKGGLIADTGFRLTELGFRPSAEPGDVGDSDSEIADLLRQQLAESQRALAITQAQMPIFQQFMPRFHQGGIVQGPMGAERPVMAQAGEGIFTRDQMRAMGSQNITVVIEDAAIDSNRIRVEVDGVIQDKVSTVRRQGSNRRFVTSR